MHQLTRSYGFLPLLNSCRLHTRLHSLQRASHDHFLLATFSTPYATSNNSFRVQKHACVMQSVRYISEWNTKRQDKGFTTTEKIVVVVSLGVFMLYFLWLREPSDIDENMNRPIWERVPGIDPEVAQGMMEMDKYLGLQVDYTALEQYKKEYYAKQVHELEKEKMEEERYQQLRASMSSHVNILKTRAQKPDNDSF